MSFGLPGRDVIARENRAWEMSQTAFRQAADRERWHDLGRRILGQRQEDRRERGEGFVWVSGGLPEPLPDGLADHYLVTARQVVAAEYAAREGFATAERQARAWVEQNHPSEQLARLKWEEFTLQPVQTVRAAIEATERAAVELGRVVEAYRGARQVVASAAARRAAIEQDYRSQIAAVDAEVAAAELTLGRL